MMSRRTILWLFIAGFLGLCATPMGVITYIYYDWRLSTHRLSKGFVELAHQMCTVSVLFSMLLFFISLGLIFTAIIAVVKNRRFEEFRHCPASPHRW